MLDLQRILVPIDLEEAEARRTLSYAAALARSLGVGLDVLHVWTPPKLVHSGVEPGASGGGKTLADVATEQAATRLSELTRDLPKLLGKPPQLSVAVGDPGAVIAQTAEHGQYGMIVMGTRGRSQQARLPLGSVAERVVRLATCPVLTVPPP